MFVYTPTVSDPTNTRKLDAIVGSALRVLVENGADDSLVGLFAARHREKVAEILAVPTAVESAPDLVAIVRQAVSEALSGSVIDVTKGKSREKASRIYVVVEGRRTSVTISRSTVSRLVEAKGGAPQAKETIQTFANHAPKDIPNRSAWIEERVQALLAFGDTIPEGQQHRH